MSDLLWQNVLKRLSLPSGMVKTHRGMNKKFSFQSTTLDFMALGPDFDKQMKLGRTEPYSTMLSKLNSQICKYFSYVEEMRSVCRLPQVLSSVQMDFSKADLSGYVLICVCALDVRD